MAFTFEKSKNSKIKIILSVDNAIGKKDKYNDYLESFKHGDSDETLLELSGDPTRFVFRRSLTFEAKQKLRSKNFKMKTKKGDDESGVEIDFNYSYDLIRMALIDIENPTNVEKCLVFKAGNDGYCSTEIINILDDAGVLTDLISAYMNATNKTEKEEEEEKNS